MTDFVDDAAIVYLGETLIPVWQLTIDAFLKFQLKRTPMGQNGVATFQKTILKLLVDNEIDNKPDVLDSIVAFSIRYATSAIKNHDDYPEEARAVVITNMIQAFVGISEKYITR